MNGFNHRTTQNWPSAVTERSQNYSIGFGIVIPHGMRMFTERRAHR